MRESHTFARSAFSGPGIANLGERTTQRPHAEYDYTLMSIASGNTHHVKNTYPIGIYCCLILDRDKEIFQVSECQERALSIR